MALYSRSSDLIQDAATWSVVAGSVNALYPLANLSDRLSHTVTKATGTSLTVRATYGGARTLQAVAFIHTNATAIQLTNGAGLNQAVTIPSVPGDGLPLDPWIELRELGNTSSTTWDVALTGPSGVGIGEVLLAESIREIEILLDSSPAEDEAHPALVHPTEYGVKLKYGFGTRKRIPTGSIRGRALRADVLALQRANRGQLRNFLFIPDDGSSDALHVDLGVDSRALRNLTMRLQDDDLVEVALIFEEQQKGLAL